MMKVFNRIVQKIKRSTFPTSPIPTPQARIVSDGPCSGVCLYVSDAWTSMISGHYDKFIYDALENNKIDLEGSVVWDVGAHLGYHSFALAKWVGPQGYVLAFEPNPYNKQRLILNMQANCELAERIILLDDALSDVEGEHSMQVSIEVDRGPSSGSYLDYGKKPSDRYKDKVYENFSSIKVRVTTADAVFYREEHAPPKFVKIDIEGAEERFLRGAHALLTNHKPVLVIEIHNIQCMFSVFQILVSYDYHLHLLDDGVNESSRCFILAIPNDCQSV